MNPKPLERKIESQRQDILRLEGELLEKNAFLQGLIEALKLFPKNIVNDKKTETVLRPGSDMAKARDYLASHGSPAHIVDILEGIGKENSKLNRLSLSSSLAGYARKHEIFEKTDPNTFTLIGLLVGSSESSIQEPPQSFGQIDESDNSSFNSDVPF